MSTTLEVQGKTVLSQSQFNDREQAGTLTAGEYEIKGYYFQVSTMPSNPATGDIVQWIGTTGTYTNGYFYKYNGTAWEQVNVQPAGGGSSYTAGDGISITNNEIAVKVGEGLFFDDSDQVCLNNATQQTLSAVSGKEGKGKVTIGETEYTVAISTTDAGTAGYITFVVEA